MANGVSTSEARAQLRRGREELSVEREALSSRRRRIREQVLTPPTRKESLGVASRFRAIRETRRKAGEAPLREIKTQEEQFTSREQELQEFERSIETAEAAERSRGAFQRDVEIAKKAATSPEGVQGLTPRQQQLAQQIRERGESSLAAAQQAGELRTKGFTLSRGQFTKEVPATTQTIPSPKAQLLPLGGKGDFDLTKLLRAGEVKETKIPKVKQLGVTPSIIASLRAPALPKVISFFKRGEERLSPIEFTFASARSKIKGEPLKTSIARTEKVFATKGIPRLPEDTRTARELFKDKGIAPSTVRAGFRDVGTEIFKLSTKVTKQKATPAQLRRGGRLPGETLLFGTLLGPVSATKGRILKEFATPAKVQVVGASQQLRKGKAVTDVAFRAEKGGRVVKGLARGVTQVTPIKGTKAFAIKGQTVGTAGRRALTIKGISIKEPKVFISREAGLGGTSNKLAAQITTGKVAVSTPKTTEILRFQSAGLQTTKGKLSTFIGGTQTERGGARVAGILFKGKVVTPKSFAPIPVGKAGQLLISAPKPISAPPASVLGRAGFGTTLSGIRAGVSSLSPLGVSTKTPALLSLRGLSVSRPETLTSTKLAPVIRPSVIAQEPISRELQNLGLATGQQSRQALRVKQQQLQSPISAVTPATTLRLRSPQRLRQPTRLVQITELTQTTKTPVRIPPFSFPTPKGVPPVIAFPSLKGGERRKKRKKRKRLGAVTFVPGFTSRALGITEKVTPKQLRAKALRPEPIGLRKIPILQKGVRI